MATEYSYAFKLKHTPLWKVHAGIERAVRPFDVLGLKNGDSASDIREAYKALALLLHPDKTDDEKVKKKHTYLFIKVQRAYEDLCAKAKRQEPENHASKNTGGYFTARKPKGPTHVPTPAADFSNPLATTRFIKDDLHARNWDFRERLKVARAAALKAKTLEDEKAEKLRRRAAQRAAELREEQELEELRRQHNLRKHMRANPRKQAPTKDETPIEVTPQVNADRITEELASWPKAGETIPKTKRQRALAAERRRRDSFRAAEDEAAFNIPHKKSYRKHAKRGSDMPASSPYNEAANTPLVSRQDLAHRWHKQLLSGGTHGSVSLIERDSRLHEHAAARLLQWEIEYYTMVRRVEREALKGSRLVNFRYGAEELAAWVDAAFESEVVFGGLVWKVLLGAQGAWQIVCGVGPGDAEEDDGGTGALDVEGGAEGRLLDGCVGRLRLDRRLGSRARGHGQRWEGSGVST